MSAATSPQASSTINSQNESVVLPQRFVRNAPWLLSLILLAGTFLLYCSLAGYQFIGYDDQIYVTENYIVLKGITLQGLKWAFTTFTLPYWHPITWVSHMLDVEFFGVNPAAHHYMNLLLHSINAAVLFLLLRLLTGRTARSFVVATLFAVHPLSVESVMWIAERKNLLCTLFFMLGLGAYAWYARKPNWKRYLLVTVLYLAALMCKPMVVTFPFVLLLLDYWPLERWESTTSTDPPAKTGKWLRVLGRLSLEKLPWFALSIANAAVTFFIGQVREGAVKAVLPLWARVANALLSYGRYLAKIVWPQGLCIFYPHPRLALPWMQVALSAVIVLAITLTVIRYKTTSYLIVGWLWFLGTLVPVIGIVQSGTQAMADRYAYLSFIGIFVAAVWGIADLLQKKHVAIRLKVLFVFVVLLVLGWQTRIQKSYWHDSTALFTHALEVTENNDEAHVNLAAALTAKGDDEGAIAHARAALAINPHNVVALEGLALYHFRQGSTKQALDELNQAASLTSYAFLSERIHMNLGAVYSAIGEMEKAKSEYRLAIQIRPENYQPYLNLGAHLYVEGKYDEALQNLNQSIAVFPTSTAYYYQGQALQAKGRLQEAGDAYRRALRISPQYLDAQKALSELTHTTSQ